MKKIFIYLGAYVLITGTVAGTVSVIIPKLQEEGDTPSEKFLAHIMDSDTIAVEANVNVKDKFAHNFNIDFDGTLSLGGADLNVAVDGDIVVSGLLDNDINASFAFLDNYIYLSYGDYNVKCSVDCIQDIVSKVGEISAALADFTEAVIDDSESDGGLLAGLDINSLTANITNLEFTKEDKYLVSSMDLFGFAQMKFYANKKYQLQKVEIPNISVEGYTINVTGTTDIDNPETQAVVSPENAEHHYYDCSSVLPLANSIVNIFKERKVNLGLAANVYRVNGTEKEKFITLGGSIIADLPSLSRFNMFANLNLSFNDINLDLRALYKGMPDENGTREGLFFALDNIVPGTDDSEPTVNNILDGRITYNFLRNILTVIKGKTGTDALASVPSSLNQISGIMSLVTDFKNGNYSGVISGLNDIFTSVKYTDDTLEVILDCKAIGIAGSNILISINLADDQVNSFIIKGITYDDYSVDFAMYLNEFPETFPDIESKEDFADYEPLETIYDELINFVGKDSFAFNIDMWLEGNTNATDPKYHFTGYVQLKMTKSTNLDGKTSTNYDAYLDLLIVKENVTRSQHVTLQFKDNEIYGVYNSNLKIHMDLGSIQEIIEKIKSISKNSTDNEELTKVSNSIISLESMPIMSLINGDLSQLKAEYLDGFKVDVANKKVTANGGLFGMTGNIELSLDVSENETTAEDGSTVKDYSFDGITVSGLVIGDSKISINLGVANYDESKYIDYTNETYFELSNIKDVLFFGINNYEQKEFHLEGNINLILNLLGKEHPLKDITLKADVILSDNGGIDAKIQMLNIPLLNIGDYSTIPSDKKANQSKYSSYTYSPLAPAKDIDNRDFTIYLTKSKSNPNGTVYMQRVDDMKFVGGFLRAGSTRENFYNTAICTTQQFMSNIMHYICKFGLGFSDSIMEMLTESEFDLDKIEFENVITALDPHYESTNPYYVMKIDMDKLLSTSMFSDESVTVYTDGSTQGEGAVDYSNTHISSFDVSMTIASFITLNVNAGLVNYGVKSRDTVLTSIANELAIFDEYHYIPVATESFTSIVNDIMKNGSYGSLYNGIIEYQSHANA